MKGKLKFDELIQKKIYYSEINRLIWTYIFWFFFNSPINYEKVNLIEIIYNKYILVKYIYKKIRNNFIEEGRN